MRRKALVLCFGLVLSIALSGCGNKKSDATAKPETETETAKDTDSNSTGLDQESKDKEVSVDTSTQTDQDKPAAASGTYQEDALFEYGLVPVEKEDSSWGYMNQNGEWVVKPQYKKAFNFGPTQAAFVKVGDKKFRCIDTTGEFVSDQVFLWVSDFSACGIAKVQIEQEGKKHYAYFYQDSNGEYTLHFFEDDMDGSDFSSDGYAVVWKYNDNGDAYGVMDKDFNYALEPQAGLHLSGSFHNGICVAIDSTNQICGYMKPDGTWAIKLATYDDYYQGGMLGDNGLIATWNGDIFKASGEVVANVGVITKDLSGAYEVSSDYTKGNWILITAELPNSTYLYNYVNEKGELVFPYQLKFYQSTDIKPRMCYDRLVVKLPVIKDGSGKVTGISATNDEDKEEYSYVVMNEAKEIVFVPEECGVQSLATYRSDGYTTGKTMDSKYAVIDNVGNIVFQTDDSVTAIGMQ